MIRALVLAFLAIVTAASVAAQPALAPLSPDLRPPSRPVGPAVPPVPPPSSPSALAAVTALDVRVPDNDNGRHFVVSFTRADGVAEDVVTAVFRRRWGQVAATAVFPSMLGPVDATPRTWAVEFAGATPPPLAALAAGDQIGPWTVAAVLIGGETEFTDEVSPGQYEYVVAELWRGPDGAVVVASAGAVIGPRATEASWFNTDRAGYLGIVLLIAGFIGWYVMRARDGKELYVRRLPGVDAIEDSIGRSTEMGRPVLYVTGLEEIQNIQTIASLLILGHVAEKTAEYDTDLTVANYYPLTMVVAEEVVRQGYANAGRIDAHRPERCLFITAEQFAFAAGVSGIILRERPATNIYFGTFFGESLLLAETGFTTGAVQIAGTAELTQLPFFITACDYTLIGEELYAASAYLTKEPTLLANLKAADAFKIVAMLFIVIGVSLATAGVFGLGPWVFR